MQGKLDIYKNGSSHELQGFGSLFSNVNGNSNIETIELSKNRILTNLRVFVSTLFLSMDDRSSKEEPLNADAYGDSEIACSMSFSVALLSASSEL